MARGKITLIMRQHERAIAIEEFLAQQGYEVLNWRDKELYRKFGEDGFSISDLGEGAAALTRKILARSGAGHLVISDLAEEALILIKQIKGLKSIDVIVTDEKLDKTKINQALELGVKELISWPCSFEFLAKAVSQLLAEKALGKNKKHLLRRLKAQLDRPTDIELIWRETRDIREYVSGSEILTCRMGQDLVKLVSLYLLHLEVRHGVCLSTSLGCSRQCLKCWSGTQMDFVRHFSADELLAMTGAVLRDSFYFDESFWLYEMPFFVALMGSGDVADNFSATMTAMTKLHHVFGDRFVCNISTALVEGVKRLREFAVGQSGKKKLVPHLQVSLDSVRPVARRRLVDTEEKPLDLILEAALYVQLTGRPATMNFVMCRGVNDIDQEIEAIARHLRPDVFKLKLSKSKFPPGSGLVPSTDDRIDKIARQLEERGFAVEVFDEAKQMGFDTGGSCGTIVHDL